MQLYSKKLRILFNNFSKKYLFLKLSKYYVNRNEFINFILLNLLVYIIRNTYCFNITKKTAYTHFLLQVSPEDQF